MSSRYQRGSVRREKRSGGEVWVWRFRVRGVMKQEKFPVADIGEDQRDIWRHLEPAIARLNGGIADPVPMAPTLGKVIDKYKKEHLSELAKSTRDVDSSMLESTIRPKWGDVQIAKIRPMEVDTWIKKLKLASLTKQRAKRSFRSHGLCSSFLLVLTRQEGLWLISVAQNPGNQSHRQMSSQRSMEERERSARVVAHSPVTKR